MNVIEPKVVVIPSKGLFEGRNSTGVFLNRHSIPCNLTVVETETDKFLDQNRNRSQCLMILEGFQSYRTPENVYLDGVVNEHGIDAFDPIIKPFTAEISHSTGENTAVAALAVLVNDVEHIYGLDSNAMSDDELQDWFDLRVKTLAVAFDLKPSEVIHAYEELFALKRRGQQFFLKEIRRLSDVLQRLIDKSNQDSKLELSSIIVNKRQPNILAVAGMAHEPVFMVDAKSENI